MKSVNLWQVGAIVLCAVSLTACSNKDEDKKDESNANVEARSDSKLQGVWASSCADAQMFGNSQRSELEIGKQAVTRVTYVSSSGNCGDTSVEVRQSGSLELGAKASSGVREINFGVRRVRVKPINETGVSILNAGTGFCGFKDWRLDIEKDVSKATGSDRCYEKLPAMFYDVYSLEEDKLYFGEGEAARQSTLRPTLIDRDDVYTRR